MLAILTATDRKLQGKAELLVQRADSNRLDRVRVNCNEIVQTGLKSAIKFPSFPPELGLPAKPPGRVVRRH